MQGAEIGTARQVRHFRRTCWCRENLSNGIQVRDVRESIDGTLKPGGIGLRISSRAELECVPEPPRAAMAGAHCAAQADPGRSGSPRRTGTARPTTMVLDADVVVEPLTDDALSESIRTYSRDATSSGQLPAGLSRLPVCASALDRPLWELVSTSPPATEAKIAWAEAAGAGRPLQLRCGRTERPSGAVHARITGARSQPSGRVIDNLRLDKSVHLRAFAGVLEDEKNGRPEADTRPQAGSPTPTCSDAFAGALRPYRRWR